MLLGETFILTLMGTASGIFITFLVQAILKQTNPGLTVLISAAWIFSAVMLAFVGAATGAIYPALRAASYDPVVALAYE
jgi:putative ABC transport system permease protein